MSERQYGIPAGHLHGTGDAAPPPHDADIPSPYPERDVSPVRDQQAHRDVDSLYNAHMNAPSPDPYGVPSPYEIPPAYPSQHSLAPLTANNYSPPRSPERTAGRDMPAVGGAAAGTAIGAGVAAAEFGRAMPGARGSYYHGDSYEDFDPSSIADDPDDVVDVAPSRSSRSNLGSTGAGAGAGSGFGEHNRGSYGPVGGDPEKSVAMANAARIRKRKRWLIGAIVAAVIVVGAIAGGVAGGLLGGRSSGDNSSSSSSGSGGSTSGGLYDINSKEVQKVLNNDQLHKVFPAMDYTPNYAQYPECLAKGGGPLQNNVTIDVAIMSQLTPAVRLYGTDCNQTELVLEAIDRLDMADSMKVWLGVYLDGNKTSSDRQIAQMYKILDNYSHDRFVGVIVGNEVLYAKTITATQLGDQLDDIRKEFSSKGINLPVATADLGDNWTQELAQSSDIVMANIHPFFAGVAAKDAAGWAYSFWNDHDVPLTTSKTDTIGSLTYPKQIISEIGWPSQGGNDCGVAADDAYGCTSDTDGSVASIDNMNTFMDDWVCGAVNNGTTFFWFEAFDEPWKHKFDTAHNKWEPFWGLFDINRNLKDGLKIPDCGKTVDKPY